MGHAWESTMDPFARRAVTLHSVAIPNHPAERHGACRARRFEPTMRYPDGEGQSGTFLQTRGELSQRLEDGVDIGAEVYNTYGPANNLLPVSQQSHLAGPFVSLPLNQSLTLRTSALIGLTAGSTDATFRVFLTQRF